MCDFTTLDTDRSAALQPVNAQFVIRLVFRGLCAFERSLRTESRNSISSPVCFNRKKNNLTPLHLERGWGEGESKKGSFVIFASLREKGFARKTLSGRKFYFEFFVIFVVNDFEVLTVFLCSPPDNPVQLFFLTLAIINPTANKVAIAITLMLNMFVF